MKRKIPAYTTLAVAMLVSTLFSTNSYSEQIFLPGTAENGWYDTSEKTINFDAFSNQIFIDFDGDHSTFAYARPSGWSINWGTYGDAGIGHSDEISGGNSEPYLMFGETQMGATSAHANHVAIWNTEWFYIFLRKTDTPTDFIVSFQMSDGLVPIPVTAGFWYTTTEGVWEHFDPSSYSEQIFLPGTAENGWYDTFEQTINFDAFSNQIFIDFDGDHSTFAYARPSGWSINWGTYGDAGIGHSDEISGGNSEPYLMFGETQMGATSAHANHVAIWNTEWFYIFLGKTDTPTDFIVSFQMSDGLVPIPVTAGFWYTTTEGVWEHFDPTTVPEPSTALLHGTALLVLMSFAARRQKS